MTHRTPPKSPPSPPKPYILFKRWSFTLCPYIHFFLYDILFINLPLIALVYILVIIPEVGRGVEEVVKWDVEDEE
jgi:hypothetical protein